MTKSRIEAALPLTPLQKGMLFHALYDEDGIDVYAVQVTLDLTGPLRPERLRAAADQLVARHAVLRAGFLTRKSGEPVQLIGRDVEIPWTDLDLAGLAPDEQARRVARYRAEQRATGFDMARPPLLRVALAKLAEDHHVLVLTYHHILLDAWSMQLVVQDLFAVYALDDAVDGLPAVVPFTDYLGWLEAQDREAAGQAWTEALSGLSEPTLVAGDRSAGERAAMMPTLASMELSEGLSAAVTAHARAAGVTMNSVVQGVWALMLAGLTGRQDVVFGQTVSGRPAELDGVEEIVGLLINAAPVRVLMDPAESLTELFARVQREQAELERFHFLGLADIQRAAGLGDLYDTTVAFASAPMEWDDVTGTVGGLRVTFAAEAAGEETGVQHYPMNLTVSAGRSLRLALSYRADLYDEVAVDSLLGRIRALLETYAAAPATLVGRVTLLTEQEWNEQIVKWNDTERRVPDTTLPDLFEAQVARTPDAVALIGDGERVTYAEFAARVDRMAAVLTSRGVRSGDFVAVALRRSVDLVVALHAVVATGAAYVPVDPDYPRERVGWILEDSTPALLVTSAAIAAELPPVDVPRLLIDGGLPDVAGERPERRLFAQSPAYVIFTSGSTGRPKGVMVPHSAIVTNLLYMQDQFRLGTDDRVLLKTSASFDTSLWELFWAPQTGAAIVIAAPDGHKDAAYLAELVQREHVTTAYFVPSMLAVFLQEPAAAGCRTLRRVITAGEVLPEDTRNRFLDTLGAELHNMYGPTETTVIVTHAGKSEPETPESRVTIGKPIWNSQAYVLDDFLRPVPVGVAGELYLGGALVASGYVGRFGLTAERFVADPYGEPGSRMYRSGDVVRWTPDGDMEFIGRADGQVKLRGQRIELGEIESVLSRHPSVGQVAVIVHEDPSGSKRLVGYVVPAGDELDKADLIEHSTGSLPAYMVPSALVELAELPLTPNGKLDRKALARIGVGAPTAGAGRPPRGVAEETLAGLYAEVLRIDAPIGAEDNFFDLGGDSIMSIQLVARARRAGLVFTPKDVFTHRTVTGVARVAKVRVETAGETPEQGLGELPATPIMQWLRGHTGPSDDFHQAALLRVPATLGHQDLVTALQAVLDRHDALRMRRVERPEPAGWAFDVARPGSVHAVDCVRRVDATGLDEESLRALITAETGTARTGLSPDTRQLVRVVWFDAGPETPGRLLILAHHLAVDAVSWSIIVPDLRSAWNAVRAGEHPALAPVSTSVRTWSRWLDAAATDPARVAELPLWTNLLAGGDAPLADRPLDPELDKHGTAASVLVELSPADTEPLLTTVPAGYRGGVDDVLLTALALAVEEWSGVRGPVLVDVEGHGRQDDLADGLDLSRTVGWFTNLHPVRLDTGGPGRDDSGLTRAVKSVKEQLRAIPDGGIGFGLLRRLNPETAPALAGLPVPQIGFNYLGRTAMAPGEDWSDAPESDAVGAPAHPDLSLPHLLEITAVTADGPDGPRLVTRLTWPEALLPESRVREFGEHWLVALRALARHTGGGRTPSDVLPVRIGQAELERLEAGWAGPGLSGVLPLTPMQEGLLYHAAFDPDATDVYTIQLGVELSGRVDAAALRRAAQGLVDRHETLRAAFVPLNDGTPVQVVAGAAEAPWKQVTVDPAELDAFLHADRARRFDPANPPMVRFTLIDLGGDRRVLAFTLHHILVDGWSVPLLLRDLFALFTAEVTGTPDELPAPVPLRGYYDWLAGQDTTAAENAWRAVLDGLTGPTLLAPGAEASDLPALPTRITRELSPALTEALTGRARSAGVTLNTVVQGVWAVALAELTGRRDVLFGATMSVRPPELADVEDMLGLLLSTVPVRFRLEPGAGFAEVLRRVQEESARISPYVYLGGAAVQRLAGLGPLFDASMVFQNYPNAEEATDLLPGTGVTVTGLHERDAYHYPLKLSASPGERLFLEISHRPELIPDAVRDRVADRLEELLAAFIADPDQPIAGLVRDDGVLPAVSRPVAGAPADDSLTGLAGVVAALGTEVLGRSLSPDQDFFDAGGDSLDALRLAGLLGHVLDRRVPAGAVARGRSAYGIARLLT